jgi:hypothetical protein
MQDHSRRFPLPLLPLEEHEGHLLGASVLAALDQSLLLREGDETWVVELVVGDDLVVLVD